MLFSMISGPQTPGFSGLNNPVSGGVTQQLRDTPCCGPRLLSSLEVLCILFLHLETPWHKVYGCHEAATGPRQTEAGKEERGPRGRSGTEDRTGNKDEGVKLSKQ